MAEAFDAIVLAGGGARRLGGADKGAVEVGTEPLLAHALAAVAGATRVVVVGPVSNADLITHDDRSRVSFVTEDPPRGGPAAAVGAGLAETEAGLVVALACDMPFADAATVSRLVEAAGDGGDGALLVDETGRRQYLAAAYRRGPLREALNRLEPLHGAPLHRAISVLTLTEVRADPEEAFDVDTWHDVDRSRRLWEER